MARSRIALNALDGVLQRVCNLVEVSGLKAPLDPVRVDLDVEARRSSHARGERLGAAHSTEPSGENDTPGQVRRVEVCPACRDKGLVGTLKDSLGTDVDP